MSIIRQNKAVTVFLINLITFVIAYYGCILLHEYGHSTMAWLFGAKSSPFNIHYGGWLLLDVDEHINYGQLLAQHRNLAVALSGIAGVTVNIVLAIVSFILLNNDKVLKKPFWFTLFYWILILSIVPISQYFSFSVFSKIGDMARFLQGFSLSPWLIFIPGTIVVLLLIWCITTKEFITACKVMPVVSSWGRQLLLFITLGTIILLLYTHGYNPIADNRGNLLGQIIAIASIFLLPIYFYIGNRAIKNVL